MTTDDCPKAARCVAKLLICIGSVFIAICALTQVVGVNLGALVFVAMSIIWPARAVLRCENWGRIGYLMAGPFAVWMSLQALRDAEFFQDFLYLPYADYWHSLLGHTGRPYAVENETVLLTPTHAGRKRIIW